MKHLTLALKKIELYITITLAISIFIINQTQYIACCWYNLLVIISVIFSIIRMQHFFDKHLIVEGQNTSSNCSYFSFQKTKIQKRVLILFVKKKTRTNKSLKTVKCFKRLPLKAQSLETEINRVRCSFFYTLFF